MNPVSILRKSMSGRHRPVRVADGPMTARVDLRRMLAGKRAEAFCTSFFFFLFFTRYAKSRTRQNLFLFK